MYTYVNNPESAEEAYSPANDHPDSVRIHCTWFRCGFTGGERVASDEHV